MNSPLLRSDAAESSHQHPSALEHWRFSLLLCHQKCHLCARLTIHLLRENHLLHLSCPVLTHKMLISFGTTSDEPKIQVDIHWSYIDHIWLLGLSKFWPFIASSPSYVNPVECHLQSRVQELVPPAWRGIVIDLTISNQWMCELPGIFCSACSGLVIADLDELWGPCSGKYGQEKARKNPWMILTYLDPSSVCRGTANRGQY